MINQLQSVLVVDDDRTSRDLLAALLQDDCRVLLARNGTQALERARSYKPDLILLDIIMPELDGLEVMRILKRDRLTRSIPVIMVSGLDSSEDEERGLDLGAVDYISKPFHPGIVRKRVCNHLQAVRYRRLLESMAMLDALTELPNRRRYDEVLDSEWQRCLRTGEALSLAILDIDHFKSFNDRYGHMVGDQVLRSIAATLRDGIGPPPQLLARYGGEEFVLLLPAVAAGEAQQILERMRHAVAQAALPAGLAEGERITLSIGGSTGIPCQGERPERLFAVADAALYRAKSSGRNRMEWVCCASLDGTTA